MPVTVVEPLFQPAPRQLDESKNGNQTLKMEIFFNGVQCKCVSLPGVDSTKCSQTHLIAWKYKNYHCYLGTCPKYTKSEGCWSTRVGSESVY